MIQRFGKINNDPSLFRYKKEQASNEISHKEKDLPKGTTVKMTKAPNITTHIVNIDSRARDLNKYTNPNNYRFRLNRALRNITRIDLITAEIPHTDYVVNEYNNKIDIIDNGNLEVATLTVGDYDQNELATQLTTQLNALGNGTVYTVAFLNGKYTITGTNAFSLLFSSGTNADDIQTSTDGYNIGQVVEGISARRLLGFGIEDTVSGLSATSTNKINLGGENYVILELGPDVKEELDWFDSTGNSAFGKLIFKTDVNVVQTYEETQYEISKCYDPPLRKLAFLHVKFRTYGGHLYNFRGHDHSFMLRITCEE